MSSASRPEPSASRPEPSASRPEPSASRPEPSASRPEPSEGAGAGEPDTGGERLAGHDILRLRAPNPGPMTLAGTNTWVVGREPAWVVDPGPLLEGHLRRVLEAIDERGGLGGVVLTHDHSDHSEAVAALLEQRPAPLAAARGEVDIPLADGLRFGPLEAVPTPGHASDHFALVGAGACFTGDAVLGEGSVFVVPHPGAMNGYLQALERLRAREDFDVLCPGHGPPVWEVGEKLDEYLAHRRGRERALVAGLEAGARTVEELLDAAWPDVPAQLRPAAAVTLAAHLDKLDQEGALPEGVERQSFEELAW
jgi:glyoxylase-like metal-dependent hydrolase (beta-lactamase superfamily II)